MEDLINTSTNQAIQYGGMQEIALSPPAPSIEIYINRWPIIISGKKFPVGIRLLNWNNALISGKPTTNFNPNGSIQILTKAGALNIMKLQPNKVRSVKIEDKCLVIRSQKSKYMKIELAGASKSNLIQLEKSDSGEITCNLSQFQVTTLYNSTKDSNISSVLQQEYWLLCYNVINLGAENIFIWKLSKPVKHIKHTSQLSEAYGTLIFSKAVEYNPLNSAGEERPTTVSLEQIVAAISEMWFDKTGRGLNEINCQALKDMLSNMPCEKGEDEPEPGYVTFSQFCVTRHEGQKYSFSKWVCEAMDLIVQCLCQANDHPLWKDGLVEGFISIQTAKELLIKDGRLGVFLLRFSETNLASIGPILLSNRRDVEKRDFYNTKELKAIPLAQFVMKHPELKFVLNKQSKEEMYSKYMEPDINNRRGYVGMFINLFIRGVKQGVQKTSYHNTINEEGNQMDQLSNLPVVPHPSTSITSQVGLVANICTNGTGKGNQAHHKLSTQGPIFAEIDQISSVTEQPCTSITTQIPLEQGIECMETESHQNVPCIDFVQAISYSLQSRNFIMTHDSLAIEQSLMALSELQVQQFNLKVGNILNNIISQQQQHGNDSAYISPSSLGEFIDML